VELSFDKSQHQRWLADGRLAQQHQFKLAYFALCCAIGSLNASSALIICHLVVVPLLMLLFLLLLLLLLKVEKSNKKGRTRRVVACGWMDEWTEKIETENHLQVNKQSVDEFPPNNITTQRRFSPPSPSSSTRNNSILDCLSLVPQMVIIARQIVIIQKEGRVCMCLNAMCHHQQQANNV